MTKPKPDAAPAASDSHAPAATPDPLRAAVAVFVEALCAEGPDRITDRLLVELRAVGVSTIQDAAPHRLGDLKRALGATLGYDAHALLAAIEPHRRTK
ncbi:MAG: hypothetical protein JXO22_06470 [Phycisphaerae bacterium]|nr:hypothetical protein [Phycisphaerae bacterium]